ncbi:MAG TPA: sigma-70 family RNA polymerase sigma factor [Acidimicrobiales bacterium]|nr:sigma-70 family RNA polymerase sigma factor [Acidimicrobiales bacterium]
MKTSLGIVAEPVAGADAYRDMTDPAMGHFGFLPMSDVDELLQDPPSRQNRPLRAVGSPIPDGEWVARLESTGQARIEAVAQLHALMLRATRHQIARMAEATTLGGARRDEIAHTAADEATMSALRKLDSFEGRSRFTTWAYKFGILRAGVEVRRTAWRHREIHLDEVPEPSSPYGSAPEAHVEATDLAQAIRDGLDRVLTDHQRQVAVALLVDGIPIDVLSDRMGTTRNALYKTLHDARARLRAHLATLGFAVPERSKEVRP